MQCVVARVESCDILFSFRLQKFREESSNLYFNAKSSWRWCEFSSHPRVMVYADRTGAELTDIRVKWLFLRVIIGQNRVLHKYLVHCFMAKPPIQQQPT